MEAIDFEFCNGHDVDEDGPEERHDEAADCDGLDVVVASVCHDQGVRDGRKHQRTAPAHDCEYSYMSSSSAHAVADEDEADGPDGTLEGAFDEIDGFERKAVEGHHEDAADETAGGAAEEDPAGLNGDAEGAADETSDHLHTAGDGLEGENVETGVRYFYQTWQGTVTVF